MGIAEYGDGNPSQAKIWARLVSAIAEPVRIRLMACIHAAPDTSVGELADAVGEKVTNVSFHLQILRNVGLIQDRRDGRFVRYSLAEGVRVEPQEPRDVLGWNLKGMVVMLTAPPQVPEPFPPETGPGGKPKKKKGGKKQHA